MLSSPSRSVCVGDAAPNTGRRRRRVNGLHGPAQREWCGPAFEAAARPVTNAAYANASAEREKTIRMKRANWQLDGRTGSHDTQCVERMTIRLISVVEENRQVRVRLRAQALDIDLRIWLEVRFTVPDNTTHREWATEAYERALAALDPT
jgi:hypothetical protein